MTSAAESVMQLAREPTEGLPRERAFLLLRYTLILATAYLLLVEGRFFLPPPAILLLIAAALASNLLLTLVQVPVTSVPSVGAGILVGDTLWITAALLMSDRFSPDFFYLYFFMLLLAAMGEDLRLLSLATLAACGAYAFLFAANRGGLSLWHSPSLIRIPFLFTAAIFYGYLVDQTRGARRRAYAALQKSEEQFRAVSALTSDYAYTCRVASDGTVALDWATETFERITGFSLKEMEARGGPLSLLHREDLPSARERLRALLSGKSEVGELRIITKAGDVRWIREHDYPVWDDNEQRVVRVYGAAQDITARREAEEALRRSEERYRSLFENMQEGLAYCRILLTNGQPQDFIFLVVNDAFETLTGLKDVEGKRVSEVIPGIHASDPELLEIYGRVALTGKPERSEIFLRALGMWFAISVYCPEPEHFIAVFDVITKRKRAEAKSRRLNADLEQRVRERTAQLEAANKELEAFSYSVSHDLRAPLRAVDGFSGFLLDHYGPQLDAQGQRYLQGVRKGAKRMNKLINDLLALSHITRREIHRQTVDLSGLARTIAAELHKNQPERQVEFAIADGVMAEGDAGLLRDAMENLLANAWKYTSKHATARIDFGVAEESGQPVYFIRDDGAGFDMTYVEKLFGAFQRLHSAEEFEGTGIGLATVQRIIHRHGGRIWAEGAAERGATFYFTLRKPPVKNGDSGDADLGQL